MSSPSLLNNVVVPLALLVFGCTAVAPKPATMPPRSSESKASHPPESHPPTCQPPAPHAPQARVVEGSLPRQQDPRLASSVDQDLAAWQELLTRPSEPPADLSCPPPLSTELAELLYQSADRLIKREDEHVSIGALKVILPLLRLAAHSGHRAAQRRYGFYVIGYYMTDEMFWPHDKETAMDALAMLRVVATDVPELVGENKTWILGGFEPADDAKPFAKEWLTGAKASEAQYRKCHATK